MDQTQLSLLHRSIIPPASPSPQGFLFLSASDIVCRNLPYNRRILFFRIRPRDYSAFIDKLKSSLSRVLVDFYPLAGRLREGDHGRLEVVCNDLGAEFVEALVNGLAFSDLEREKFVIKPIFQMFTQWATYTAKDEGAAPLLSIQVTRFDCGNVALGIAHSHVVADGHSLWHFMVSWAECGRGAPISMRPTHERTLLRVENSSKSKAVCDLKNIEDVKEGGPESGKTHMFQFSQAMMRRLKQRAGGERISSYEALCAHIWRCASRARGHAMEKKLAFTSVVNMRRKMDPPLPEGFFGNALLWGTATATRKELEEEELITTAMRVRASTASCTSSAMEGWLQWLELYGMDGAIDRLSVNRARMRVSSSPKFPVYDVDFGWGKPVAVRSAVVEELGKIVLYPGADEAGSVDVNIALPVDVMLRLQSDPSFIENLAPPSP